MSKSRHWCFTINGYTEEIISSLVTSLESLTTSTSAVSYAILGREIAPTTGAAHIQGFISFSNPRHFGGVKAVLGSAHIEAAKGTAYENFVYCSKEAQFTEFGTRPVEGRYYSPTERRLLMQYDQIVDEDGWQLLSTENPWLLPEMVTSSTLRQNILCGTTLRLPQYREPFLQTYLVGSFLWTICGLLGHQAVESLTSYEPSLIMEIFMRKKSITSGTTATLESLSFSLMTLTAIAIHSTSSELQMSILLESPLRAGLLTSDHVRFSLPVTICLASCSVTPHWRRQLRDVFVSF